MMGANALAARRAASGTRIVRMITLANAAFEHVRRTCTSDIRALAFAGHIALRVADDQRPRHRQQHKYGDHQAHELLR